MSCIIDMRNLTPAKRTIRGAYLSSVATGAFATLLFKAVRNIIRPGHPAVAHHRKVVPLLVHIPKQHNTASSKCQCKTIIFMPPNPHHKKRMHFSFHKMLKNKERNLGCAR